MTESRLEQLHALIADYERQKATPLSEADVLEVFIRRLFEIISWDCRPPTWNRQVFIRGAGFADVGLQIEGKPALFIEAKRFNKLPESAPETVQGSLWGDDIILSLDKRQAYNIDRTPDERQAIRYARAKGVRWAILTNFERLVLFNADTERLVMAFDQPQDYVDRFDDLKLLGPEQVKSASLEWYEAQQAKADIDTAFLKFLREWRLRLAQAIYDHNPGSPARDNLDLLLQAVQRTLDRLIIIRYADDFGVLRQHDLLDNALRYLRGRGVYAQEYDLQNALHQIYYDFYRAHDTTIFAPGHICEQVKIPNDVLIELVEGLEGISFRKFTSDILGNTYESYLGQRFTLADGKLRPDERRTIRKGEGIYYTPRYIVEYIVDHTLGRWLYGTQNGKSDGALVPGQSRKTIDDVLGTGDIPPLRILDPAMGSGSFLIYAFDVLADFYEAENRRLSDEYNAAVDAWSRQMVREGGFGKEGQAPMPVLRSSVDDYVERILQDHLYGVDLDPEAVEIACVNLIMRAFDRLRRNGRERKLPLILRQNLKVGNSLISAMGDVNPNSVARLISLRAELRGLTDNPERHARLDAIDDVASEVNAALNENLRQYFADVTAKTPFHWTVEFPEAFDARLPEAASGFTIIIGNPPYIRIQYRTEAEEDKLYLHDYYESANRNYDIYVVFIERGAKLLARGGSLGFIVPNKFFQLQYGEKLREMLTRDHWLDALVNLTDNQVFPGPTTYTCLLFLRRDGARAWDYVEIAALKSRSELPAVLRDPDTSPRVRRALFPAEQFSREPWTFAFGRDADILAKIKAAGVPLREIVERVIVGVQTSADDVYILKEISRTKDLVRVYSKATGKEHELESGLLKPLISGEHVERYGTGHTDHLLLFPYEVKEGKAELVPAATLRKQYSRTWKYLKANEATLRARERGVMDDDTWWYAFGRSQNLDKQELPKLAVPRLVDRLKVLYDSEGALYLDNVDVNGVLLKPDVEPLYLMVVLNSKLLDWTFKKNSVHFRGQFYSANRQFIESLPIHRLDPRKRSEREQQEALVKLARRMIALKAEHVQTIRAFDAALCGFEREARALNDPGGYWESAFYQDRIKRHALIDANQTGDVFAIAVDEQDRMLVLRAAVAPSEDTVPAWRDIAQLEVADQDLRLFLLLSLRAFLEENKRKQVWSRGKPVLNAVLGSLQAPHLLHRKSETLEPLSRLMAQVRDAVKHPGRALHLSEVEQAMKETDREMDRLVYALYGLSEDEIAVIEGQE